MAEYTITEINKGIAKVTFNDGSWAEVILDDKMTETELDDAVFNFAPKAGTVPPFLSVGDKRTSKFGGEAITDSVNLTDADLKKLTQNDIVTMGKNRRNMRLEITDWVILQCLEQGQAVPDEWKTYRQALRDLPAQDSSVWNPKAEIDELRTGYSITGITMPKYPTLLPDGKTKTSTKFSDLTD